MLSKALLEDLRIYLEARQTEDITQCVFHSPMAKSESMPMPLAMLEDVDLDSFIKDRKKPGFAETLLKLIDARGLKDSVVYLKAGLDRRHFSKIRSNPAYQPSKHTAVALALALELSRRDAEKLLAAAGYTLSESDTFDLIICWCLERGIYDLIEVNQALDYFSQKTIGPPPEKGTPGERPRVSLFS